MTETRHARTAPIYGNMLEMIGNTPMLEVTRMDTGPCRLFVKMESMNPGNSIKDRIAVSMIEAAESKGLLKPGGLIVEATAGNTGLALALVGSQKGYTVVVVVPDKMSGRWPGSARSRAAVPAPPRLGVDGCFSASPAFLRVPQIWQAIRWPKLK